MKNQQIKLIKRPEGQVEASCFEFNETETSPLNEGEVLIKTLFLSIDPAMRGWMNAGKSYIKPVEIGEVMRALGIGEIIESKSTRFKVGDHVSAGVGVQNFSVMNEKELQKVDPNLIDLPVYLGTLGMSGLTAYFGILDTGQPKAGETVLVSGAAGAVGSVVGQIAKLKGCKVIGIAGSDAKIDYVVNDLGFDSCINYKSGNLYAQLKEHCPDGVDVYFDNVGGEILDAALAFINKKARIVICGAISQYNETKVAGPKNYLSLLVNRAKMEGIVVFDNAPNYGTAIKQMSEWISEGKLNANYQIETGGINAFYDTLMMLFNGGNQGKLVLKIN